LSGSGMRPQNQARPSRTSEDTATGSENSRRSTPKSRKMALFPDPNGISSIRSITTTSPGFAPLNSLQPRHGELSQGDPHKRHRAASSPGPPTYYKVKYFVRHSISACKIDVRPAGSGVPPWRCCRDEHSLSCARYRFSTLYLANAELNKFCLGVQGNPIVASETSSECCISVLPLSPLSGSGISFQSHPPARVLIAIEGISPTSRPLCQRRCTTASNSSSGGNFTVESARRSGSIGRFGVVVFYPLLSMPF
jgi:hypothetical protein